LTTSRDIARNTFYLASSHIVTRLLGLLVTMVLMRYLGLGNYGELTLAYAYLGLFSTLIDAGLDLTLIRTANQLPDRLGDLLGNGFLLRGLLAAAGYLLAAALLPFWGYPSQIVHLLRLALLMLLLLPLIMPRLALLVTQQIRLAAALDVIVQLVNTVFILCAVRFGQGSGAPVLIAQIAAFVIASPIYFAYTRRFLPRPLSFRIDFQLWRRLLVQSWPLAISGMLYVFQIQVTRLLVGRMLSATEGGWYTAAYNLATSLSALPVIYFSSVYPLLAKYYLTDVGKFRWLYQLSFKAMMMFFLPFVILISLTSRQVMTLYAGVDYLPAASLLIGLVWIEAFQFASVVLYYTILAAGQQRVLPWVASVLAVVRVGLNVILLPRIGLAGTVVAGLAMYGAAFIIYGFMLVTRSYVLDWLRSLWQPGAAALILAVLILITRPTGIVTWVGGLTVYGLLLVVLRAVKAGDVSFVRGLIGRAGPE